MTRQEFNVSFQIHPKPDGGYEAVSENPPLKIEGATREEVEQQIRVKMVEILGPEIAAMLPVSFAGKLQPSGPNKASFTVKKTFRIGAGLSQDGANITSTTHTFTTGGKSNDLYRVPAGDVVSSSSSEDSFGPIRRTGDGSSAMLLLRIAIAVGVVLTIILLIARR